MYYCYSIKEGLFDEEMSYAKDLDVFLFYDEKNDKFLDKNNNSIDIKGKKIFPRTGALQTKTLVDAVIRHGGDSLVKSSDYEKTLDWPKYFKTQRRNIIMTGKEIIEDPTKIVNLFGTDRVFFKTKNKNYSQILPVEKVIEGNSAFHNALKEHQNDDFIISDVVEIIEDESGPLEYRAFIVNGEILNISRAHDYLLSNVPICIIEKLEKTIKELAATDFPKSYVIDLFIYLDNNSALVDVLECNPIVASGTYLYNTVFKKSEDLLHNCPSKSIPAEKIKYGPVAEYGFNVTQKPIPSICYNLPGGFAADLRNFTLFGKKSSTNQFIHIATTESLDPTNIGISPIASLNSDTDFDDNYSSLKDSASADDFIMKLKRRIETEYFHKKKDSE